MAVKVLTAEYEALLDDVKTGGLYLQICDGELRGRLEFDGVLYSYSCRFKPGFRSDGASVPRGLRWFLPSWAEKDPLYNALAKAHDLLYSAAGKLDSGERWTRSDSDDFLRGGWRESPTLKNSRFARFRAACGNLAVAIFAGGKKHWGNNSLGATNYAEFSLVKIDG